MIEFKHKILSDIIDCYEIFYLNDVTIHQKKTFIIIAFFVVKFVTSMVLKH